MNYLFCGNRVGQIPISASEEPIRNADRPELLVNTSAFIGSNPLITPSAARPNRWFGRYPSSDGMSAAQGILVDPFSESPTIRPERLGRVPDPYRWSCSRVRAIPDVSGVSRDRLRLKKRTMKDKRAFGGGQAGMNSRIPREPSCSRIGPAAYREGLQTLLTPAPRSRVNILFGIKLANCRLHFLGLFSHMTLLQQREIAFQILSNQIRIPPRRGGVYNCLNRIK